MKISPAAYRTGAATLLMMATCTGQMLSGTASAGASSSTYLVGVSEPMTGAEAQAGTEIWDGEVLAANAINAAGGVLGHKIVLKEEDDACDPQTSENAANKLVSLGVQAMVGGYCSSAAQPAEPIYARAGIPNIQVAANSSTLTEAGYHDVFLIDPGGGLQAEEAAGFFTKVLKVKSLLIADDQSTYAVNVAQLTQKDLAGSSVKVFAIEAVPDTDQDFSALINTIRADKAGAVYWTGYFAQAAEFVRQLRTDGLEMPFVTADGSVDPTFVKDAGADSNGTYATIAVLTGFLTGTQANAFDKSYKAQFHSQPGPYSAYGYDGMYALADAAKAAGSLSPGKVIAALHKLKFHGLTGEVSFAPDGSRLGAHFVVLEVKNGQYELAPVQPPA
ncbi:MAG TPA: branched-chain amino acid ABC transporter substrate-binding protein [Acidimicrobiales bacterium]|nr:branched-chain amino acid ABC transporter substrate-binding protein [Acidimicrobiales bacterium]